MIDRLDIEAQRLDIRALGDLIARSAVPTKEPKLDDIDYSVLPRSLQIGAQNWIEEGVVPGTFLELIIRGDIRAVLYADAHNLPIMQDIVRWWTTYAPSACWGSDEKVTGWKSAGGTSGIARLQDEPV